MRLGRWENFLNKVSPLAPNPTPFTKTFSCGFEAVNRLKTGIFRVIGTLTRMQDADHNTIAVGQVGRVGQVGQAQRITTTGADLSDQSDTVVAGSVSLQTPVRGNAKTVSIGFCPQALIARRSSPLTLVSESASLQTPVFGNAQTGSIGFCPHTLIASGSPASAQGASEALLLPVKNNAECTRALRPRVKRSPQLCGGR